MTFRTAHSKREVQRSFALSVVNGALFNFAERLTDPPVILTRFVSNYTSSNLLIGLVEPLGNAGWLLPQLFISSYLQPKDHKKPTYVFAAVVRTAAFASLAASVWLIRDNATLLLTTFFVAYAAARLASGLSGLSFFDIIAKTIPAQRRGSMFAMRQLIGSILGLGAGWIVTLILNRPELSIQRGHAILFAAYTLVSIPALGAFIMIREPAGETVQEQVRLRRQLQRAGESVRQNPVYRRYLAARLSLGLTGMAIPFYTILAKDVLRAPAAMSGLYVTASVAAQMIANLFWGRLSDRRGNRLIMRLYSLSRGASLLLAIGLLGLARLLPPQAAWLPYLALPLYIVEGATRPAQILSGSNFLLEFAPAAERPLYLGLSNTLMGLMVLISGLGGLVVDLTGFGGLFVLSLILSSVGYLLATRLPEPRQENAALQ